MKRTSLILAVAIASACSNGIETPSVEDTLRQAADIRDNTEAEQFR